jgi:hypothetical protein
MGMLEAREGQSEVIEPMRQRDAGNRDAERAWRRSSWGHPFCFDNGATEHSLGIRGAV